jgi:acetylornithine deacetylase
MTQLSDVELLARLVAFETVSERSNLDLVDAIADYLDGPDVEIVRHYSPDRERANLLVKLGPAVDEQRNGLVLCGHLDVVPATEPEWNQHPFQLATHDDRLVGRGTADMKGFISLAVNLFAQAKRKRLKHPLALLLTRDEEVGTQGAYDLVERPLEAPLPRHTVVGEPTGMKAVRVHKGHTRMRVTLRGRAAHSGYPHLGKSAIAAAGKAINALTELAEQFSRERAETSELFPAVPFVPLNVGTVQGGRAVNVVADHCTLELGLRPLPKMDCEALYGRIERALDGALDKGSFELTLLDESPPHWLDAERPIYRHVCQAIGQTCEASVAYATDAGWLGQLGLECVICGPGSIEVAHRPNEHIEQAQLQAGRILLEQLLIRHCLAG